MYNRQGVLCMCFDPRTVKKWEAVSPDKVRDDSWLEHEPSRPTEFVIVTDQIPGVEGGETVFLIPKREVVSEQHVRMAIMVQDEGVPSYQQVTMYGDPNDNSHPLRLM